MGIRATGVVYGRVATSRRSGGVADGIETAVIVPTLGTRPDFLAESLTSIRSSGRCMILLVRPPHCTIEPRSAALVDGLIDDPGGGLAAAINAGIAALPASIRFATWLGDDDRLISGSLDMVTRELARSGAMFVYGGCRYIDAEGREVWLNRSGRWAVPLMRVGPQLVPQPGSLFDRNAFDAIGGLDVSFKWAFDLDMFLRLARRGSTSFVHTTLAEFRWHEGSLSVGGRMGSVTEASAIRRAALPRLLRPISILWEPLLRIVILKAGERISRRMAKRARVTLTSRDALAAADANSKETGTTP